MPAAMAARVAGLADVVVAADRHLDTFRAGLKSFVNEARLLARFDHPSLVKVYRFWEENGTAYMVMPYYEGPTLKAALAELGHVPSEAELRTWLKPILNAVTLLHDGARLAPEHRPRRDPADAGRPGPARLRRGARTRSRRMNHTPAAALKAGFAAIEQYGSDAGDDARPVDRPLRARRGDLRGDHRQRAGAAADRLADDRLRPLAVVAAGLYSAALPGRDRRRDGGAAEAAAGRSRRVPRPDGRHRSARGGVARAAAAT